MNEQQDYDISITLYPEWKAAGVSIDELRLLSAFFPEILKELIVQAEREKE